MTSQYLNHKSPMGRKYVYRDGQLVMITPGNGKAKSEVVSTGCIFDMTADELRFVAAAIDENRLGAK